MPVSVSADRRSARVRREWPTRARRSPSLRRTSRLRRAGNPESLAGREAAQQTTHLSSERNEVCFSPRCVLSPPRPARPAAPQEAGRTLARLNDVARARLMGDRAARQLQQLEQQQQQRQAPTATSSSAAQDAWELGYLEMWNSHAQTAGIMERVFMLARSGGVVTGGGGGAEASAALAYLEAGTQRRCVSYVCAFGLPEQFFLGRTNL